MASFRFCGKRASGFRRRADRWVRSGFDCGSRRAMVCAGWNEKMGSFDKILLDFPQEHGPCRNLGLRGQAAGRNPHPQPPGPFPPRCRRLGLHTTQRITTYGSCGTLASFLNFLLPRPRQRSGAPSPRVASAASGALALLYAPYRRNHGKLASFHHLHRSAHPAPHRSPGIATAPRPGYLLPVLPKHRTYFTPCYTGTSHEVIHPHAGL
jgi:hypothetical protein